MNEIDLLREVAQETPLPSPAELEQARARLVAAITAAPASLPQPVEPAEPELVRPPAPAPVERAVRLMWGGAVGTAAQLIIALFYLGDIKAYHLTALGHHLTTAQLIHWRPLIATLAIAFGLVEIALWLWTARAAGRGQNWARVLSAVLTGLATLQLSGTHGAVDLSFALLTWLTGVAAVWQLWRPASTAFFKSQILNGPVVPGTDPDRRP